MKKLGIILCLFSYAFAVNAQNEDYRHVITVNTGFSIFGTVVDIIDDNNLSDINVEIDDNFDDISNLSGNLVGRSAPAFQINYDYGVEQWFSIGGGISYQAASAELNNLSYTREADNEIINLDFIRLDLNRLHLGTRALFHYGNREKLDMYSGIRLGITNWVSNTEISDEDLLEDFESGRFAGLTFAAQIIPFALRGYVTDNIGLNFELGVGAPHYLSIGLNYRL